MIVSRSGLQKVGWAVILTICGAMLLALTFKVNAVKSQVRLTERQILAVRQEKDLLETEFETRANQHQLTALNEVEFGYSAPTPGQYLDGERSLAELSKPRAVDAPTPVMVASADEAGKSAAPAAERASAETPRTGDTLKLAARKVTAENLGARLSHVERTTLSAPRSAARE